MRTLCALLVIALLSATTAAVAETAPAAEAAAPLATAATAPAAAPEPAELSTTAPAELETAQAALSAVDSEKLAAEIEAALAQANVANLDAQAMAEQVQAALAQVQSEQYAEMTAQLAPLAQVELGQYAELAAQYAPLAQTYAECAAGECPFATALTVGGNDDVLKAVEELQAAGELSEAGAQRLKELLAAAKPHAMVLKGLSSTPQVFGLPEGQAFEWRGRFAMPEGSTNLMEAQPFAFKPGEGQNLFGTAVAGNTAALEERIAKLEAQLEQLTAKLDSLQAGEPAPAAE